MVKKADAVSDVLSPLESKILETLWESGGEAKVREIYGRIRKRHPCAQTSVAVTLDRLYARKLVSRRITTGRGGLAYIYRPLQSREQFQKSIVQQAVDRLVARFGDSAINYFDEKYRKNK
ncbi:BlaI/MecI/CopY family transcriptional regulator [Candidatus Micrarchaeota archaeon]|nr:BlaI/MecI/CopY family transcriptional regulator [Candidatus Micrarchaeota archaeon]